MSWGLVVLIVLISIIGAAIVTYVRRKASPFEPQMNELLAARGKHAQDKRAA